MASRKISQGGAGANDQAGSAEDAINQAGQQGGVEAVPPRFIYENGQMVTYTGPGLVNSAGEVERESPYPADFAPALYNGLSPANQDILMSQLERAGLIEKSQFNDPIAEVTAVARMLSAANANGITYKNYLGQRLAGRQQSSGGGGRTYRTSNPDELKLVAKQVAQQTLGRGFTDEEADRFVRAFQAEEIAEQRRASGGGTMVQAPAADVAAQEFAEQEAPTEASAYKTLGYINKFFNAIGGV
jgi:hypothetical protein